MCNNDTQSLVSTKDVAGVVDDQQRDGRGTYVYALTNPWGRTWVGWPLARVLGQVQDDSRGVRFNMLRAYRHARLARAAGGAGPAAPRAARYHGFSIDRLPRANVDWSSLASAPDTVLCLPPPKLAAAAATATATATAAKGEAGADDASAPFCIPSKLAVAPASC